MNTDLWKYCTPKHCTDFILSLKLLDESGLTAAQEITCLYTVSNHIEKHYHSVIIPKQTGGTRRLFIPDPLLKKIQRNILRRLLVSMPVSPYAAAYRKGSGIKENASVHVGQKQILKLDIEGFYDSILFPLVMKSAFPYKLYPLSIRTLLTNLCCYREHLPQGAPTSPYISNLILKPFDTYMGKWCEEREITYSRYCDDMTFSGDFESKAVKNKVKSYLKEIGFSLNERKTGLFKQSQCQSVTGIVVNVKPQVSKKYRNKLRQEIYYCCKFGVVSHLNKTRDMLFLPKGEKGTERYLMTLMGKVNFILQVNPQDKEFLKSRTALKNMLKKFRGKTE